jgi:hypothetical protein
MKMRLHLLRTLKPVILKKKEINFEFLDSKYLNQIAINQITNPTIANVFFVHLPNILNRSSRIY